MTPANISWALSKDWIRIVRAATRTAIAGGVRAMGIKKGYRGLIDGEIEEYDARKVSNILDRGGTVLYTDRCDEFKTEAGQKKALETCLKHEIDGIVAIGGDGTFRGAADLCKLGIPAIGVPGTIDNDITASDYSIGFDTAMNTVIAMVDRLRDTHESHARCAVVEVMGRNAGDIALNAGIAVGAVGIDINEIPFDEAECIERMKKARANKKRNFVIVIVEGRPDNYGERLTKKIEEMTGVETRFARLAHVQRGGSPTLRDRLTASVMGNRAVELLLEGKKNLVVCTREDRIVECGIDYALALDRRYKGKMDDAQFAAFCESDQKSITEFIEQKKAGLLKLYELSKTISV
jgi:6-phosphofructokinase 1